MIIVERRDRTISFKPSFLAELSTLSPAHQAQVMSKIRMIATDPEPDAKTRKRLRGATDGMCRLRSGDFRIFYTYGDKSVSLFSIRARSDDTYDTLPEAAALDHGDFVFQNSPIPTQADFARWATPPAANRQLPEAITEQLLSALKIPAEYHARLKPISTQEALLGCPGVPDDFLLAIDRHMFEKPLELVAEEPTLIAPGGVDDLLRYTEGKIVTFLLDLDPEQRKYVTWGMNASGPTLVKGGPGTGKSTVALYRVREMIQALRKSGIEMPRILFTTYTNALVTFSKQLLQALLRDDAACVDVRTADSLVGAILSAAGERSKRPNASQRSAIQKSAMDKLALTGSPLQRAAQLRALERLGHSYVFEEVETVIHGRGLKTVEQYLSAPRPGRRVGLQETHRRAIWAVNVAYDRALEVAGFQTWQQARSRAAEIAETGAAFVSEYDAVVVDEAQDLDAGAIRLLVTLCAAPNRLFLTADESQSIYAAGFGWADVHEHLQFRGRTGVLRSNYRSTRQIMEAAHHYLAHGLPKDLSPDEQSYVHGGAFPAVRRINDAQAEVELLARFLRGASRDLRLTIGSGAVIVPDKWVGDRIATGLTERGIPATYRDSRRFELDDNTVTVLPLQAAKGLEFPIVAIAGFIDSQYPFVPDDMTEESRADLSVRERRTLFVAMTRAMRALLLIAPSQNESELFDGFDSELWNTGS